MDQLSRFISKWQLAWGSGSAGVLAPKSARGHARSKSHEAIRFDTNANCLVDRTSDIGGAAGVSLEDVAVN
jgi:hypothetical protein